LHTYAENTDVNRTAKFRILRARSVEHSAICMRDSSLLLNTFGWRLKRGFQPYARNAKTQGFTQGFSERRKVQNTPRKRNTLCLKKHPDILAVTRESIV